MNEKTVQTDMKVHMHTYMHTHMFVYLSVCIDVYYVCKYLGIPQESMFNIVLRFIFISVHVSACHFHMGVHEGSPCPEAGVTCSCEPSDMCATT